MRRFSRVVLIFILFPTLAAVSQVPMLAIRLHDEAVYFPDSTIEIMVSVQNETPQRVNFQLADDRTINLRVVARDSTNRTVPQALDGSTARRTNQVLYRTVSLLPGEQISFVEPLTRYVDLSRPDHYSVHVEFLLDPLDGTGARRITSNTLLLTVQPGETQEMRTAVRMEETVRQVMREERLSPDEVVRRLITSRQEENWERFFLYLDLESLYREDPARERSFVRMSEAQQMETLERYRDDLRRQATGTIPDLVGVPDGFEILETRYTATAGEVTADLFTDFETYRETRRYTYDLERRDGFWRIVSFSVVNLPNQPLPQPE